MEEKILETIVVSFTKTILSEGKALFDELYDKSYDEIKQFIGKDLKAYLTKQKDKYSYIKTLLRGNTPVYLYDVYFPAKLLSDKDKVLETNSAKALFSKFNYVTIIGDAGSGKSTLVKHLFLNSIHEQSKIPVLIELRYVNDLSDNVELYIKNSISQNKLAVNTSILEKLLEKGKFTLFLDGFDEVDEKTKKKLVKQINDFVNKYNSNFYLLTSRPYSNVENLPLFTNLKMKDLSLSNGEISGFVYKQLASEMEIAEKAIKSIEQGEAKYIHSFLKNPLLLSLYLLTFQNYASIPDKKYIFYRRVINALFSEHDSKTKLGYVREKLCGLDQEGFETVLKSFSFLSYFENEFSFDNDYINLKLKFIKERKELKFDNTKFLADLKSAISLWVDDDGLYSFAHRSLQEYFTALFITELKEEENIRVYNKIIKKYEDSHATPTREIDNLLQLLREMDEYSFIKNFYFPLLNALKNDILSGNQLDNGRNFLYFFTNGILELDYGKDSNGSISCAYRPLLTSRIYKTIFLHLDYTQRLYDFLSGSYENLDLINNFKAKLGNKKVEKDVGIQIRSSKRYLIFNKSQFDELTSFINLAELNTLADGLMIYIETELSYCESYIDKSDLTEKDLVDLI